MKIFNKEPSDWKELQDFVGIMFKECGFETEVSKVVGLVRGQKEIDVYARDLASEYKPLIIVECKYWSAPVNQETVHAFRTVVNDLGANIGLIISKNGFQSGCYEAIRNTNIKLLSLEELENEYYQRWKQEMVKKYLPYSDNLFSYWDPVGSKVAADGSFIDYDTHQLLMSAYDPIWSIGPHDFYMSDAYVDEENHKINNGFERKYPMNVPVLDDNFATIANFEITNDRSYFDFCEENKEKAFKHFKLLFKEN